MSAGLLYQFIYTRLYKHPWINSVFARSRQHSALTANTGIVVSNPAQDIKVCSRLVCLCCLVQAVALRDVDPSFRECYQMSCAGSGLARCRSVV
jgi:hypothetical protein